MGDNERKNSAGDPMDRFKWAERDKRHQHFAMSGAFFVVDFERPRGEAGRVTNCADLSRRGVGRRRNG